MHHRANPWFAPPISEQCAEKRLAIYGITLGTPGAAGRSYRRGIHYPAFGTVCFEQPVQRETIQSRFLNGRHDNCLPDCFSAFALSAASN